MVKPLTRVNDFVVKFANVNGSGSASANGLFARSVLKMGVPVAARNIFPSNIQGLPTWYEVRVVEAGWRGRRGGVDLMVAMNPETWVEDVLELEPGGYLFYDSTKPLPPSKFREDVTVIAMPLMAICNATYTDPRQRQLFKNIIYLGALASLLSIQPEVIEGLLAVQYKAKQPLLESNRKAFRLGYDYAREHLPAIGLRIERREKVGNRIFIDGNNAAALGAVYGGATVCAWYPITPSSSLAESFAQHCQRYRVDAATGKHRYAIVQGRRRARVHRHGHRRRLERRARVHGHGRTGHLADAGIHRARVFRGNPGGAFRRAARQPVDGDADEDAAGRPPGLRVRVARRHEARAAVPGGSQRVLRDGRTRLRSRGPLQTPVFVMMDLDMGMQDWLIEPLTWDDDRRLDRGKVMTAAELEAGKEFGRYLEVDGDGIPYRTYPGTHPKRGGYFTRGTSKDAYARYTEDGHAYVENMQRLLRKFETAKGLLPKPVIQRAAQATHVGAIWFGSTGAAMAESLAALAKEGIHLDQMRIRGFPFADEVAEFIARTTTFSSSSRTATRSSR
jgi:2-oxoglutarate ferredoxin oxidoreductase subunit alpha